MLAGDFTQVASSACNARGAVTLIYRNIIRKDLLKLILHEEIYKRYFVEVPDFIDKLIASTYGTMALDAVLAGVGVTAVHRTGWCTRTDERFFSHRRDGAQRLE